MHIHYNTTQTTLPLEISFFLQQDHLVFTIEQVVNTLEDSHFHAFYHAFGRPSYHPKMLVSALLFAYSQGIFSGRKAVPNRTVGCQLSHHQSFSCR
nr:transposase [Streptococcus mitis]